MSKIRKTGEGTYWHDVKNNTWQYKISVGTDADGKAIRKTFYAATDKEARQKGLDWLREHNDAHFGSNQQQGISDDGIMMTPFPNDAISNILNDAKPYRNVVKRYWTEEEVNCFKLIKDRMKN